MIKLENIGKIYRTGTLEVVALREVNLEISKGEFIALIGPSGSGKSTLLHILGCLDRATSGHYFLEGKDVVKLSDDELAEVRGEKLGFVFQAFNLFPRKTVLRNLELPMVFAGRGTDKYRSRMAMKTLYEVGIPEKAQFTPMEISGGQQQKVAIARSLINKPALLLADEPTGNLDSKSGEKVMSILKDLNYWGTTIVLSTHDERIAMQTKRIITIFDGENVKDEIIAGQK